MFLLDMSEGKSKYVHMDFNAQKIRQLIGEFEVKELVSDDFLLVSIEAQIKKIAPLNGIAMSLTRQKVYGRCVLLSPDEAKQMNLVDRIIS